MKDRLLYISLSIMTLLSCSKSSLETTYISQAEKIDTYVSTEIQNNPGYRAVTNHGIVRLIIAEGEGEELGSGGSLSFWYEGHKFTGSSINNSNLFATNKEDLAKMMGWNTGDSDCFIPYTTKLDDDSLLDGLRLGLEGIRAGEDCYIIFTGKFGFAGKHIGTIPANSALAYRIQVTEISNR